jgi:predicted DNA-binding ribbon-helix-helix protein
MQYSNSNTDQITTALNEGDLPQTTLVSRNITVMGRRTSVRLEPEMWAALREIAGREQCTIHDICTLISVRKRPRTSLTAAIRVFLMLYFRASSTEDGHSKAGHGDFEFMKQRARIPTQLVPMFSNKKKRRVHSHYVVSGMKERLHSSASL